MKKCVGILGLALTIALGWSLAATAASYDLATDFSVAANPNGVWSYGWTASRGSAFYLDTETWEQFDYGHVIGWQAPNFLGAGSLAYAVTEINHPTVHIPQGELALHPGPYGQCSVVRWTAPSSGIYRIDGWFTGDDHAYPTTTDVAVLRGSVELFAGEINSYRVPLAFSLTERVGAGETIDFSVGVGRNGNYIGDATGIDVTITEWVIPVAVDIKPDSSDNTVNLGSAGVIPVAILSSADFSAPDRVEPGTISLAGARVKLVGKADDSLCRSTDVNLDGLADLLCKVNTAQFMIEPGESRAVLEAETFDGIPVRGEDTVAIVP